MNDQAGSTCPHLPRLMFFGGKGGVGKTTVSSAIALALAEQGRSVMLVSVDPAHSLSDILDVPLDDSAREVTPGLKARELDPDRALDAYVAGIKDNLRRYAPPDFLQQAERYVDQSARHPSARESALFEAMCRIINDQQADHLIFDTAPTGHVLHLLSLPEAMTEWTGFLLSRQSEQEDGPAPPGDERQARLTESLEARQALFSRTRARLLNTRETGFIPVFNPDIPCLRETERLLRELARINVNIPWLVANRCNSTTPLPDFCAGRSCLYLPALKSTRLDKSSLHKAGYEILTQLVDPAD